MKKNNIKNLIYSFVLFPLVFTFYPLYEDNSLENNSSNITMQKDKNKDYTIEQISAGSYHSAAVINNNGTDELYTWGENKYGQLGLGDKDSRNVPTKVTGLPEGDIEQISMGGHHSAAVVNNDGTDELYTWGSNNYGQLGLNSDSPTSLAPVEVDKNNDIWSSEAEIEQISLGANYSSAVINSNRTDQLYTWGNNENGQLGLDKKGQENEKNVNFNTPQEVTELPPKNIEQISMGDSHSSAIVDSNLYTWGRNRFGQLGNGNMTDSNKPVEININNYPVQEVSLGNSYSTAIVDNSGRNELYTWGIDNEGQLGNGNNTDSITTPQAITSPGGDETKQISAGENSTASIDDKENLYTWGDNENGTLGLGDNDMRKNPTKVEYFSNNQQLVKTVSMGNDFSIAIVEENGNDYLYTWGLNDRGQLGLGNNEDYNTPQLVRELSYQKPSFVQQWYFYVIIVIAIIFLIALALISVIIIRKKHSIA